VLLLRTLILVGCATAVACDSKPPVHTPPSAPVPVSNEKAPPIDVAATVALLTDPNQAVRDKAAEKLRAALADESVRAKVDRGEAYWKDRIAAATKLGMSIEEVARALDASRTGGASGGGSTSMGFQLDDYWSFAAYFNNRVEPEELFKVGPVSRSVRHAWVEPPKGYSGPWVTYYVNGVVSHDIVYKTGSYVRLRVFYANGQRTYEQNYVNGRVEGPEIGFHENGKKAYSIQTFGGVKTGRWTWWHDNGKLASEETYVNGKREGPATRWRADGSKSTVFHYHEGKETGQAGWDESGKQTYATGTAATTTP
jgi:antitoxin component YwqK of YwqJK toxin-antitoxin module